MLDVNVKKSLARFDLDLSFSCENGQILGVIGPSGCGKSMMMKCIAGLEKPDAGHVLLGGEVLFDTNKKVNLKTEVRHIGYCFQNYALFENRTALGNVIFGLEGKYRKRKLSKKEKEQKAMELLELVGLKEQANQYPATLSGGQKQRVALARMMADEPKVWLLDEPFSAVDALTKEKLYASLKDVLAKAKGPVLLCSHDPKDIEALCSDFIEMDEGKIIRKGKTHEIF
jgi:molybdate transport system ATP-binding protein